MDAFTSVRMSKPPKFWACSPIVMSNVHNSRSGYKCSLYGLLCTLTETPPVSNNSNCLITTESVFYSLTYSSSARYRPHYPLGYDSLSAGALCVAYIYYLLFLISKKFILHTQIKEANYLYAWHFVGGYTILKFKICSKVRFRKISPVRRRVSLW